MRNSRWAQALMAIGAASAAAVALVLGCSNSTGPDDGEPFLLPDFTLNDVNPTSPTFGQAINFTDRSSGSVTIVYFGSASCTGCREEFAALDLLVSELLCEGYPVFGAMINNVNAADQADLLAAKNARIPALQDVVSEAAPLVGRLWECEAGDELIVADTSRYRQYSDRIGSTHAHSLTDEDFREEVKVWVRQFVDAGESGCLTVEGYVKTGDEIGVPGVQVIADYGRADTTDTDGEGHWIFSNILADSITIVPVKEQCAFEPATLTFHQSAANVEFVVTCPFSTVGGHVRDRFDNGVWTVTVDKECGAVGSTLTNRDTGHWFMSGIPIACVFRPSGDHMIFDPVTQTSHGDQQDLDFTVTWDLPVADFTLTDVNPESPTAGQELSFNDLAGGKDCLIFFGMADCPYCVGEFGAFSVFVHQLQNEQIDVAGFMVNHPDLAPYADRLQYAYSDLPALQDISVEVGGTEIPALHHALGLEPWNLRMDSVIVLITSNGRVAVKAILDEEPGHVMIASLGGQAKVRDWLQNTK